jgi:Protein of unknown function (DUF1579)
MRTCLSFLVVIAMCGLAQTQSNPAPSTTAARKPGAEVMKLAAFEGKWKVEGTVPSGAMGSKGGKATGRTSCEWVAQRYGLLCHEDIAIPGANNLTDVFMVGYDDQAKNYVFLQVNEGGGTTVGHGSVDGDTWTWDVDANMNGKPFHMRFTQKQTAPGTFEFKNEIGNSADDMHVMMEGKEVRVSGRSTKAGE